MLLLLNNAFSSQFCETIRDFSGIVFELILLGFATAITIPAISIKREDIDPLSLLSIEKNIINGNES